MPAYIMAVKERKWKWKSLSCVRLFVTPWTIQSMEFSRPAYWSGWPFPSPGDLPNPGIKPRSSTLQVDSLPAEPQGKPKSTGVGSLSLLQGIFPTQELSRGPLRCRWTLYQLSHKGSPRVLEWAASPFSSRSPWPRNWAGVSCVAGEKLDGQTGALLAPLPCHACQRSHQYSQLPLLTSRSI